MLMIWFNSSFIHSMHVLIGEEEERFVSGVGKTLTLTIDIINLSSYHRLLSLFDPLDESCHCS